MLLDRPGGTREKSLLFQQTGVKLRINVDLSKEGNVGNHEGTPK